MDSDVLDLECTDDLENQPKVEKMETEEKIESKTEVKSEVKSENLTESRLLWIMGIDESVKANDFRVAFEPYGKGTETYQTFTEKTSRIGKNCETSGGNQGHCNYENGRGS